MRKKKVLLHSNTSRAFTGFGKNAKNVLSYLVENDCCEVVEAANGKKYSDPSLKTLPWKAVGTLPDNDQVIEQINQDPNRARGAGYGHEMIDRIIKEERPDLYIGMEDIWAFEGFYEKDWWNKTTCMIWTTLDSLPLLPAAVNPASLIKNYYVWASFAEREMHKLGINHVKTLRGAVHSEDFFRLSTDARKTLRARNNLPPQSFIIGFVFRNQLRKSVPNILDGFKMFLQKTPESNARLLLHTHWGEGWDIPRLLHEKGIDPALVLTTYYCSQCGEYEIKPFSGHQQDCKFCGAKESQNTTNVGAGVNESQLNEIYNLMDVYCHPFTSGGQEIPVQEAKLTELITLVTNYSCGEDCCTSASGGFPLEWAEYREPGTQFIKASTYARSIDKQLTKVFKMKETKRRSLGRKARQFVLDNFSKDVIGKQVEEIIKAAPFLDDSIDLSIQPKNPQYPMPNTEDDGEFIKDLYQNILNRAVDQNYQGYQQWMQNLKQEKNKEAVYNFFIKTAHDHNNTLNSFDIKKFLDPEDKGSRILVVSPSSGTTVLYALSMLASIKRDFPDYNIYFSTRPDLFSLLDGNPFIHKFIPFDPSLGNSLELEGFGDNEGHFQIVYNADPLATNLNINSHHNGQMSPNFSLALCTA